MIIIKQFLVFSNLFIMLKRTFDSFISPFKINVDKIGKYLLLLHFFFFILFFYILVFSFILYPNTFNLGCQFFG